MSERKPDPLAEAAVRIARTVEMGRDGKGMLDGGDVAALKRMDPEVPHSAFWRLAATLPDELRAIGGELRWALAIRAMAVMAPNVQGGISLGTALRKADFANEDRPMRVNRLLGAEGEAFDDLFLSACRFLASKAQPFDWGGAIRLVLRGDPTSRRYLARAFFSVRPTETADTDTAS